MDNKQNELVKMTNELQAKDEYQAKIISENNNLQSELEQLRQENEISKRTFKDQQAMIEKNKAKEQEQLNKIKQLHGHWNSANLENEQQKGEINKLMNSNRQLEI